MEQLLDNRTGNISSPKTLFSYRKDDHNLVFEFEAEESSLSSYSKKNNDYQYKGDVVEVFLDIGDEGGYYEFEVAPNGTSFVAKIVEQIPIFIDSSFFQYEVKTNDASYKVKMIIDLSKLGKVKILKFNAFRIETKGIRQDYILQAYSPTLSNTFHVKECFKNIPLF